MRSVVSLNENWAFLKNAKRIPTEMPTDWDVVNVPHTWNAKDGMDGGADYFRGTCHYAKTIKVSELPEADCYYLEINGANSSADVYVNGKKKAHHDGGYSTWRVDITDSLIGKDAEGDDVLIVISVNNAPNDTVYPQVADFTFYGGLYRDVNLICVNKSHFSLDFYGGIGLAIRTLVARYDATVKFKATINNKVSGQKIHYIIKNAEGKVITEITGDEEAEVDIFDVHRWDGRKDPYLYTAVAELIEDDVVIDSVESRFGCRTFEIHPEKGFLLNGKEYPLRGVSRHQDRADIGNALLKEHHEEDMELIYELGATSVRLAHYQHDQYFYDLCDEKGIIVWAEIPYISSHMPEARQNTINQMKELITQNFNHPSIVVWGLSNEITINGGADDEDMIENHKQLNKLVHDMDKTRFTTMAIVSMCPMDAEYIQIPDTVAWNHYFGWYGGETSMNGPWFDKFHEKFPNIPVACSEYGCEALNWHNSNPQQGDYTEEYQAYYHEELIKQLYSRQYLWATYVWNMFDFGADARGEGGENGLNHKGLVTIDRKYKKDAFYAYKAWLSDEPFVHICGKRYINRVEDVTKITVYSNLPTVELYVNGKSIGRKKSENHFFYFDVKNVDESRIKAIADDCEDESLIRKVDTFDNNYRLVEKNAILNWFDITEKEGYCSLNTKISDIMATLNGKLFMAGLATSIMKQMNKNSSGENNGAFNFDIKSQGFMDMIGSFTILRISSMGGMAGIRFTRDELLDMNKKLNKIKLPKKK